jgi:hypothetical protein
MCSAAGLGLAGLLLVGCSTSAPSDQSAAHLEDLRVSIDDGAECPELFVIFDRIDESAEVFSVAQGELINVGCFSRDSERNDAELEGQAPNSPWLGVPGEEVTPSASCNDAAMAAARETDSARAEPLITATLDACVSVNEWMSALALYPGVMGMMDGYIPQLLDLQSACHGYIGAAVCRDALALGLDVGP